MTRAESQLAAGPASRRVAGFVAMLAAVIGGAAAGAATPPEHDAATRPDAPRRPNVLLILTDDVGFAASAAFGGPIATPTFEALAAQGIRYNNFHTTAMCSPTRAALLTGRNPHAVGMGTITEGGSAEPGYSTAIPKSAAMLPRVLQDHGYLTAAFGKYHLIPKWELSSAGPFDRWPTSMGFGYFYGFEPAMTDQYTPNLVENLRVVEAPARADYFLEADLADRAIHWLRDTRAAAPDKPFFLYYAPATAHAPVQAPKEWIEKFRGRFDRGWDVEREEILSRQKRLGIVPRDAMLSARETSVPAWSSLSAEERRVAARMMEVYAGALSYADHQIGRILAELRATGRYEDTLVIYIQGDNGASPEGGIRGNFNYYNALNSLGLGASSPFAETTAGTLERLEQLGGRESAPAIPTGWTNALNTPFPRWKSDASNLGSVRNGMVIAWPAAIGAAGAIRRQFHAVTDVAPTIYEATGVSPPATVDGVAQQPIDGVSMRYTFDTPDAPSRRRQQYFEVGATMGIYRDGWWAGYRAAPGEVLQADAPFPAAWRLYDLDTDFAQSRDVAAEFPRKLAELQSNFRRDALQNNVFPIKAGRSGRVREPAMEGAGRYRLYPGTERYSDWGFPNLRRRSWSLAAQVDVQGPQTSGVIVNQGGRFAGWGMFVVDGVPNFVYRSGERATDVLRLRANEALAVGPHRIEVRFREIEDTATAASAVRRPRAAEVTMSVDGSVVATGRVDSPVGSAFMYQGGTLGHSTGSPLTDDYSGRFAFTGVIEYVDFDLAERR